MSLYLQYALLVALTGAELLIVLRRSHRLTPQDRALDDAAVYTIIDATPPCEKL